MYVHFLYISRMYDPSIVHFYRGLKMYVHFIAHHQNGTSAPRCYVVCVEMCSVHNRLENVNSHYFLTESGRQEEKI